ncbi:MAG: hypothetical protein CL917_07220 [Deltaproteobacteria bacterium]|nr:hypothetical protein [Deltaproteobacteria bacterium]
MKKKEAFEKILNGKKAQEARKKLIESTPLSAEAGRAGSRLAQEVVQTVSLPHPIYIESADGGNMTDVDGNTYIDTTMGFGPLVLGHRPPEVVAALEDQISKGWLHGIPSPLQPVLGDLLVEASPCSDQVVICNTGTEATSYAMRAARAYTGKQKIGTFDGCYHGAHDYALIFADPTGPRSAPEPMSVGDGIPDVVRDDTMLKLPYRDDAAFELIRKHKDELAAVFIEASQNSNPRLDAGDFLQELRDVCTECDVILGFDEVVTGFRVAYGGAQEYFGITPDIATYGKALGGGTPIGAVGGRDDIMNGFSGKDGAKYFFSGGTFSGNPLSMAAGIAQVTAMRDRKDTLYPYLMEQGNRMASEINSFCEENGFPAKILNAGSKFHLRFTSKPIEGSFDLTDEFRWAEREFYIHLLGHGVIVPGVHLAYLCEAHSPEDVSAIIEGMKQSFWDVREDGLI